MAAPHPHLHRPLLFIPVLPHTYTDSDLAEYLKECLPIRLNIRREEVDQYGSCSGTVEFRDLSKAEKALTIQPIPLLLLSPFSPPHSTAPLPPSSDSLPRVISGFPEETTPGEVWEMLRPVSLREIRFVEREWGSREPLEAIVEFWYEDDARKWEVDPPRLANNQVLSIVPYNPHRRQASLTHHQQQQLQFSSTSPQSEIASLPFRPQQHQHQQQTSRQFSATFSVDAPAFVPGGTGGGTRVEGNGQASVGGVGQGSYGGLGIGHTAQPIRPSAAPSRASSHSVSTSTNQTIDPCNLFCKNLDPSLSSNELFSTFRRFGRIVSARIMRDEAGVSRGFGFVSYQKPEEAQAAIKAMDETLLGSKVVTVRLHEPKRLRSEKLAEERRVSGSSVFSSGEDRRLNGRFVSMPETIDAMSSLGLGNSSSGTPSERNFSSSSAYPSPSPHLSPLPSTSSTPSNPIPSNPSSSAASPLPTSVTTSPTLSTASTTTTSPSSSVLSEKDRLLSLITPLLSPPNPGLALQITSMILTLKKRERALCLFNGDFLREKVEGAREVLDALGSDGEEEEEEEGREGGGAYPTPERKRGVGQGKERDARGGDGEGLETPSKKTSTEPITPVSPPDRHSTTADVSNTISPSPSSNKLTSSVHESSSSTSVSTSVQEPSPVATTRSLKDLAPLSIVDLLAYLRAHDGLVEGLQKADEKKKREMEGFLDRISPDPIAKQKQQLGERVFKLIRSWELPRSIRAPKITVHLLDNEDFPSLGHLAAEYPLALREHILATAGDQSS